MISTTLHLVKFAEEIFKASKEMSRLKDEIMSGSSSCPCPLSSKPGRASGALPVLMLSTLICMIASWVNRSDVLLQSYP